MASSPSFTSGKLRTMTPLVEAVANKLTIHLNKLAEEETEVKAKECMTNYTLECIASCGFGLEINGFEEEESTFREMVDKAMGKKENQFLLVMKVLMTVALPKLTKMLRIQIMPTYPIVFFANIIREAIAQRKASGILTLYLCSCFFSMT